MRNIRVIAVGRIKQSAKYLLPGIELYAKRISRYARVEWVEIPEVPPSPTLTVQQAMDREADAILKHCQGASVMVLLDEKGTLMNSVAFARWFLEGNPLDGGRSMGEWDRMIFIIGGANGTSEKLKEKATSIISLSPLTFPHQMVRLLLMEQLYRAFTIVNNEPYHK
jgi:23S rRNA (pseudouridine1915-N3)-methyltransferase